MQFVQHELHRVMNAVSQHPSRQTQRRLLLEFLEIKSICARLWKINLLINDRYNWIVFCLVSNLFIATTRALYWALKHLETDEFTEAFRE